MLSSFGSQEILDDEPNMQINVKAEVGGAEQEEFQRPVLVGGERGVVDTGLQRAEQTSCGALLRALALPCHLCFLTMMWHLRFQGVHCLLFTKVELSR